MSSDRDEIKILKDWIWDAGMGRRFLSNEQYGRFVGLDPCYLRR
jgi:hypothetical protein